MDRANLALAEALLQQGRAVYLVGHQIDPGLAAHPLVTPIIVPRPLNSILLGERALRRAGFATAARVKRQWPGARMVVNGGNCDWPDINWVHSVHHAWPRFDDKAPLWFRAKSAVNKWKACRDERQALSNAKLVIANSETTRRDLISLGVSSEKIKTIYLGSDPSWIRASEEKKRQARQKFGVPEDSVVVCLIGALGYDRNKGFDTLLRAWQGIGTKNAYLLAAGGGRGLERWRKEVRQSAVGNHIRLLGFIDHVEDVYAASDVMISPVRYEAFGLNVQEAICRGLPSIVSTSAGVAELYPDELRGFLLNDPENFDAITNLLNSTLEDLDSRRKQFSNLSDRLRSRTWKQMADEIIAAAERPNRAQPAG
jgi:glycosyltransferase involved in cell wall biosynthesis